MVARLPERTLAFVALLAIVGCREEPRLVDTPCREDSHCDSGFLCEGFRCIPQESRSCEVVIDGNPILQPTPHAVSFGDLEVAEEIQVVTLHNIGNCTLTLFEASLAGGASSPFNCETCAENFPIEIFPGRKREFPIRFTAPKVGPFQDSLVILSDDREFPELQVPLRANFLGIPYLKVVPNPVDFGYVAQGRDKRQEVRLTNQGTGIATVEIQSVQLSPVETEHFTLTPAASLPVSLRPVAVDTQSILTVELQYHPRSIGVHEAELVITTLKGEARIPVKGNSETPPKITFTPDSIDLGQVPLGQSNFAPLTLVNEGGAPLVVNYHWGGPNPSTDLFAVPQHIPPIAPGSYLEMQVAVTATAVGQIPGLLVLDTNDPTRPSITIPVTAEGVPGAGPEVVKVEMTFENGSNSFFDDDLRNVDLTLEHPYGYVCNKANASPKSWGNYGNPTWIAFGPKEEPERIVLADSVQDGTYRVMLQYMEDCSSIPTQLLAGLLGISLDALIEYYSGGLVPIDAADLTKMIAQLCVNRSSTTAMVKVWVNGAIIGEKTVSLSKRGDALYALDLVRTNGSFSTK